MPQVFSRLNEISDVVKWECNPIFCRGAMTVDNSSGTTDKTVKTGECYTKSNATLMTNSVPAKPEITTVTISKTNSSAADNTLIIGGVTFTAKASPSTASGTTEYSTSANESQIAAIVAAKGLTNFTVTADGAKVIYTQTTPNTGTAPTVGQGTDTTITATAAQTQAYAAAVDGGEDSIDCICLENRVIPAGAKTLIQVLERGPALVDVKNIINNAESDLITNLAARNIRIIKPSSKTQYQNT